MRADEQKNGSKAPSSKGEIHAAFIDAMTDKKLTRDELKRIVRQAMDREDDGRMLSTDEIRDLLLVSRHVPQGQKISQDWFRRYVLGFLLTHVRAKPPPTTVPTSFQIHTQDEGGRYSVEVKVVEDVTDEDLPARFADTVINYSFSDWNYTFDRSTNTIRTVTDWPRLNGAIVIQTKYGPNARKTAVTEYGRGTTNLDILSGHTSLGFHEYCHRCDQLQYLKTHPLPRFTGRIGMTEDAFKQAVDRFHKAVPSYFLSLKQDTIRRTDEVGYKFSESKLHAESLLDFYRKNRW